MDNALHINSHYLDSIEKPFYKTHTPKQTPPIKGITKSPVRSMMIVVYKGFGLVPTLWG
jgi:hypothetical protein